MTLRNVTDDQLINVPEASGSGQAAAFTSKCSAYLSSNQSISAGGVFEKVEFNTVVYDTDSEFDNITDYRFTAKVTGWYCVKANARILALAVNDNCQMQIKVNTDVVEQTLRYNFPTVGNIDVECFKDVYLTAGDYVEIFVAQSNAAAKDLQGAIERTNLSIHRFA